MSGSPVGDVEDLAQLVRFPRELREIIRPIVECGSSQITSKRLTKNGHLTVTLVDGSHFGFSPHAGTGRRGSAMAKANVRKIMNAIEQEETDVTDTASDELTASINKHSLASFDKDVRDLIIKAVNDYGWRWRFDSQGWLEIVASNGTEKSLRFQGNKLSPGAIDGLKRVILMHANLPEQPPVPEPVATEEPVTPEPSGAEKTPDSSEEAPAADADDETDVKTVKEKRCRRCGIVQPASAFNKATHSKDGLQSYDRKCHAIVKSEAQDRKRRAALVEERVVESVSAGEAERSTGELSLLEDSVPPLQPEATIMEASDSEKIRLIRDVIGADPRVVQLQKQVLDLQRQVVEERERANACSTRADRLADSLGTLRELIGGIDVETGE